MKRNFTTVVFGIVFSSLFKAPSFSKFVLSKLQSMSKTLADILSKQCSCNNSVFQATWGWLAGTVAAPAQLSSSTTASGGRCVANTGMWTTPQWFANSWIVTKFTRSQWTMTLAKPRGRSRSTSLNALDRRWISLSAAKDLLLIKRATPPPSLVLSVQVGKYFGQKKN